MYVGLEDEKWRKVSSPLWVCMVANVRSIVGFACESDECAEPVTQDFE